MAWPCLWHKNKSHAVSITGLFYGMVTNLTRLGGIHKEKFVACRPINKLFVHLPAKRLAYQRQAD